MLGVFCFVNFVLFYFKESKTYLLILPEFLGAHNLLGSSAYPQTLWTIETSVLYVMESR